MAYFDEMALDELLRQEGHACACGREHKTGLQFLRIGSGVIAAVPEALAFLGRRKPFLVADANTWKAAGQQVAAILEAHQIPYGKYVFPESRGHIEPDESAVGEALLAIKPDTECLVSVGSGSSTDTTRVVAKRTGLPQVCVGTAASMDGYTSVVCPLILHGVKIHRDGKCPEIILCDIDIIKTAPMDMVFSGVGDVLGKFIAKADWIIGNIINDEPYCPTCGHIVTDAVNKLIDNVDEIKSRSDKGMKILIEALLLAGMTIMIIGNTRAVASVEHNIAHYWEMMQLIHGHKPPQHGASVGVATLSAWL